MLVLEHIPDALAEAVTRAVDIPTIGIGAGKSCDGQVLVINDAIGLGDRWPPFSRQYAYVSATIVHAARYRRYRVSLTQGSALSTTDDFNKAAAQTVPACGGS